MRIWGESAEGLTGARAWLAGSGTSRAAEADGRTDGRETGRERIIGQQERSRRSWSEQVSFAEAWRPYPDDEVGTAGRAVV